MGPRAAAFIGRIDLGVIRTGMVHRCSTAAETTIVLRVSCKLTPSIWGNG